MDQHQTLETIKSSFLFNFRTGNVMVDTLVTGLIIMLSTYLLNIFNTIISKLDLSELSKRWISGKSVSKITISGKKLQGTNSTRLQYSTNFFAVLYQIKKLNCVSSEITELSEVPVEEPDNVSYDYDDYSDCDSDYNTDLSSDREKTSRGTATNLIVSQSAPFKMNDDVSGYVNITKENEGNEKNPVKAEEFQICLFSETLNADSLRQVLESWVTEYESKLNKNNDKHLKFFLYSPSGDVTDDYYDPTRHYSEFKYESGKTFSNVFYPEKDDIMQRLDFFTNNKAWYKKRGIPYTMGFLFYGEPGCGKTSTIKAIANHTQRHIVSVPLNKIKTAKELLNVFYNTSINYKDIPLDRRLYVLEDIDAADLKDTVGERSTKEKTKEDEESDSSNKEDAPLDMNFLGLLKNSTAFDKKFGVQKLTLAALLEVLDGVMEMEGRMLIITTNYPEKLDKALIRPGRIDMKVHFGPMNGENIFKMFKHFFEMDPPASVSSSDIPDLKWTPAEVTQVFLNNMRNPEDALMQLINSDSLENIHLKTKDEKE
jgi:hypothetical protein